MKPGVLLLALAQVAAWAVVGWAVSRPLLCILLRRSPARDEIGAPERALAALVSFVLFASMLMVFNLITRGHVFGNPIVVPVVAVAVTAVAAATRSREPFRWRGLPWALPVAFAVVLVLLYAVPVVVAGSGVRTGDPPWHMGWTEQVLAGEPVPLGPAPLYARNAYPWGLHAVLATMVRLVPGSDTLIAHEALHFVLIAAIPLAGACLARRIDLRSGLFGAAAVALVGGFGWIQAGGADFAGRPPDFRHGADLVVASPNSVYELLPPGFPRELGLVILGAAAALVAVAVARADRRAAAGAGVLVGLAGLVSMPMLLSGGWLVFFGCFAAPRRLRAPLLIRMGVAAAAVLAPWIGPVVIDYMRFGGFVEAHPGIGMEWPLHQALWAWGLLLPFAAAGVILAVRGRARTPMLFMLWGILAVLALAVARGAFDWRVLNNPTLLHQGRAWPVAHLFGAAFAGYAALRLFDSLRARSDALAAGAFAGLVGLGMASPVAASHGIMPILQERRDGFEYSSPDFGRDSFLRRVSRHVGPDDIVETRGSDRLAFAVFEFSGARVARFDDDRLDGNDLRIRIRDLAERWDEHMARGGFAADYLIVPVAAAPRGAEPLERGVFENEEWVFLRAR